MPHTTNAPNANDSPEVWLSVAMAARRLGVSVRAVQKRCASGTLPARRIVGRRGEVWEVKEDELKANTNANLRANANTVRRQVRSQIPLPVANEGEQRTNQGEREHELKDEVRFLRGIIESDRRDMAELRAALREALKLAPKQLPAPSPMTTDETASFAPRRARNGKSGNFGPDDTIGAKSLSYGDIADALEALEKEGVDLPFENYP